MAAIFSSLDHPELRKLLLAGAVGVIPTDTVYGLVGVAHSTKAIKKLYATKQRELPPGTMIGASVEQFISLGFSIARLTRVKQYWPAAISVVLDASNVAPYVKQQREALPVRIPAQDTLRALLETTGPLMTTSANAPKQPTSTSIQMAMDYFGDEVDFYVDGGDLSGRPPSTIIGLADDNQIIVYREGAVTLPSGE